MYKIALWISIGIVLALLAVYQVPRWPTARSSGEVEHCTGLTSPLTPAAARSELERRGGVRPAAEAGSGQTREEEAARLSARTGQVAEARQAGATYSFNRTAEANARCVEELAQIGSGERLRTQRQEWFRVTGLVLIVGVGILLALYFGRMAAIRGRWRRRR
ncbi:MAG TPA: hypothetical protein VIT90_16185 [Lysobacter sp.]